MHELAVAIEVDGRIKHAFIEPRTTLADFIREDCGLTGTHISCEQGSCGACTLLFNSQAVQSCVIFAVQANDERITTVEGLMRDDPIAERLQRLLFGNSNLRCQFCLPGFIVTATALLREYPRPTDDQIIEGLAGNRCSCGGLEAITAAVQAVARDEDDLSRSS